MIQKLIKQMKEREKEAQRHYRNKPQRKSQEMDPMFMNKKQLREFMRRRHNKKQKKNSQDW